MREPFQMSGDCPVLSVDLGILETLPICSIPGFTSPTHAIRLPGLNPPDIAAPDICFCISVDVQATKNHLVNSFSGRWSRKTDDCCDAEYKLSLNLDVPCMPLSVAASQAVKITTDHVPYLNVTLGKTATASECALSLFVSLDIPCMPLSVTASQAVAITSSTTPYLNVTLGKTAAASACALSLFVSLDIPCMPLSVTASQAVAITSSDTPYLNVTLGKTGEATDCKLSLFVSLDIPCMPFSIGPAWTQENVEFGNNGLFGIQLQLVKYNRQLRISGNLSISEDSCSGSSGGGGNRSPAAWDIAFAGDVATCSNCLYMRGRVTVDAGDLDLTVTLEDAYIAAHVNLYDGTVALVAGYSINAVTDATPQDDDDIAKVLLYHVVKTDGAWAVVMDYRNIPQLGVRL